MGLLVPIQKGRKLVEQEIFAAAAEKVRVFGIELLDIRFKRINYNESVRPKIYDRMISERRQIAERFLSEGNGEAARIRGNSTRAPTIRVPRRWSSMSSPVPCSPTNS
jgi:membrane protease subunit HflC